MKKQCEYCKKDFEKNRVWQKYCSKKCKREAGLIRFANKLQKGKK